MNPTGLRGSTDIAHLPGEVWTVQETQRTGLGRGKQELSSQKTNLQLTHGAAAPHRSQSLSSIGGRHTGVAVLSKYPTQKLVHHWTDQEYSTGRWLAAATCIQKRWCTVGTVYGYSENRQTLEVQQQTDQLLSKPTSRIVDGATGLRLIAGDWNLERDQIAQADYWETKGWMEAQHSAHRKWNRPIQQCTCKKTTIKDYVYVSPEILPYVQDVQLDWSTFPDHAAIMVFLRDLDSPPILPMWKKTIHHTVEERWTVIADFVRHAFPARSTSFPSITLDTWKREIRRKKRHAAIGPFCQQRRFDEHAWCVTNDLLSMLNSIEHGAPWPTQMVTGIVALLMAKTATASTTGQHRPVCVFSLCFRQIRALQRWTKLD